MSPNQALPAQAFTTTLILLLAGASLQGMAQESYRLGPGSTVGPATRIKAKCAPPNPDDGSVECDTTLENPPGDTPAKPTYHPFEH